MDRADELFGGEKGSLLDVVDNALNKGVVITGELTIGLAKVDLVYARLAVLLAAADQVLPGESRVFLERQAVRHEARVRRRRAAAAAADRSRSRKRGA
jgi:hypothetical protein